MLSWLVLSACITFRNFLCNIQVFNKSATYIPWRIFMQFLVILYYQLVQFVSQHFLNITALRILYPAYNCH